MEQYLELLANTLNHGVDKKDRTCIGTRSIFGHQMRFDLEKGFPIVTAKKTPFKMIAAELLWFLSGSTNIGLLHEMDCHIWDEWANTNGDLGPIYGHQWRNWGGRIREVAGDLNTIAYGVEGIDQIANVIDKIKNNPNDRRMIVSAWNVSDIESGEMALPPCHSFFQFYTRTKRGIDYLDCQMYQRSCDMFLGVPFNIAGYALLVGLISHVTNRVPGEFVWTGGDIHIYHNHFDQVRELLRRRTYKLPKLEINPNIKSIDNFTIDDFILHDYASGNHIAAPVAV